MTFDELVARRTRFYELLPDIQNQHQTTIEQIGSLEDCFDLEILEPGQNRGWEATFSYCPPLAAFPQLLQSLEHAFVRSFYPDR